MEKIMEVLMVLSLCVGAGAMIYRFLLGGAQTPIPERITALAMGLCFVLGTIISYRHAPGAWTSALCLTGAMLCYTAVVFSFPGKENEHE